MSGAINANGSHAHEGIEGVCLLVPVPNHWLTLQYVYGG